MQLWCPRCKQTKLKDQFGMDKSRKSGRYPWCSECASEHQKGRARKPRSEIRPYSIQKERLELAERGLKRCSRCKEIKSYEDFTKNSRTRDGFFARCQSCKSAYAYDSYHLNDRKRDMNLFDTYSINLADYNKMLAEQGGVCAICKQIYDHKLCVDHDHSCCPGKTSCGKCVRGLLCKTCNLALEFLGEDPVSIRAAANYIESWVGLYNSRMSG